MTDPHDERTDEQREADSMLEKAILRVAEVYQIDDGLQHATLERFIIPGRIHGMREIEGQLVEIHQYIKILPRGGVEFDYDTMIGMLRRVEREVLDEYAEGDE